MRMIPERPVQKEKKSLAISGVGSAGCRDVARSLSFLHSTGGIKELLASVALDKNFGELRKLTEVASNLRQRRLKNLRKGPAAEFLHREQRLGGPGQEFLKRIDLAVNLLPFFARDVQAAVDWFKKAMEGMGGIEVLINFLSSGGHVLAQKLFEQSLQAAMRPPPVVVGSLIRPHRTDAAAHIIFVEEARLLLQNGMVGTDVLVLRDNQTGRPGRQLEDQDRIAIAAMMAPFSARRSKTRIPPVEVYDALARGGGLAGIWGEKVTFRTHKSGRLPFRSKVKDEYAVVSQVLEAFQGLLDSPSSSLSNVPSAPDSQSIFSIIGNITRPTFEMVEEEIEQYGPCLFIPAPFNHIYVTRLANLDRGVLAKDPGFPDILEESTPATPLGQDLEWAFDQVKRRVKSDSGANHSPNGRRNR